MSVITKEQYRKWNDQAQNGFRFDTYTYGIWSRKELVKRITLGNGEIIEFRLHFSPEYKKVTNERGWSRNVETGRQIPMLSINRLIPGQTEGIYTINSIKRMQEIGQPEKSMRYKTLCDLSGTIDTEKLMSEYKIN